MAFEPRRKSAARTQSKPPQWSSRAFCLIAPPSLINSIKTTLRESSGLANNTSLLLVVAGLHVNQPLRTKKSAAHVGAIVFVLAVLGLGRRGSAPLGVLLLQKFRLGLDIYDVRKGLLSELDWLLVLAVPVHRLRPLEQLHLGLELREQELEVLPLYPLLLELEGELCEVVLELVYLCPHLSVLAPQLFNLA